MNSKKIKSYLNKIDAANKSAEIFFSYAGVGLITKVKRFISNPILNTKYIFWRFKLFPLKNKTVEFFWGKKIKVDVTDSDIVIPYLFGALLYSNAEYKLTKFFIKNISDNDIFYDIGANYGFYTYLANEFAKEVHSFEPVPEVFSSLVGNMEGVTNVFVNNVALSDISKKSTMLMSSSSGISTINLAFAENRSDIPEEGYTKSIPVTLITLDDYLKAHTVPTVIKLDVEGAESMVIEGGKRFFDNYSPVIAMEVCDKSNGGSISMEAVDKLRSLGYSSFAINNDGDISKVEGDLSEYIKTQNSALFDNFVFKKDKN